jgi:hypothetical protein
MEHWGIKILMIFIYCQTCLELTAQSSTAHGKSAISIHFVPQKIASESFESVGVFDVNGDGKPDLVSGSFWYEGPSFVTRHYIADVKRYGEYWDDFSTIPLDVNGDGKLDFITGSWWSGSLRWMENPGKDTAWTEHVIAKTGAIETTRGWDVDGDGTIEICPNNPGAKLKFYKLKKGAAGNGDGTFTEVIVADKQGHGLGFGDINGDGRGDFVISNGWLEAPKNPVTQKWSFHDEFMLGSASIPVTVADVNRDGLNDLIVGQAHDYGLYWYEQKKASGSKRNWVKHPIDPFASQYHTHEWVDIDNDGNEELITGKRYRAHNEKDPGASDSYGIYCFKWNGASFTKQTIAYGPFGVGKGTGIFFRVVDLRGSGRKDIIVAGKDGLYVFYNEGK